MKSQDGIVETLLELPLFESEWVLWLLFALSIVTIGVMVERAVFFYRHSVNADDLRKKIAGQLGDGDFAGAAKTLQVRESYETNVALAGLREYRRGADAAQELIDGANSREALRFRRGLGLLATIGSNAPFIGLFGTVLGIIKSFGEMSTGASAASGSVMAGISEALVATAVGLLVAIPALIAYNAFAAAVKRRIGGADNLAKTVLSYLKTEELEAA